MRVTVDRAGRVVLPKPIRKAVGLTQGQEVEVRLVGSIVEIEPVEPAQRPEDDLLDSDELAAELGLTEDGEATELEGFGPSFAEELEELAQEIESTSEESSK